MFINCIITFKLRARKAKKKLSKLRYRANVIKEIVSSENIYVKNVNTLIKNCLEELEESIKLGKDGIDVNE